MTLEWARVPFHISSMRRLLIISLAMLLALGLSTGTALYAFVPSPYRAATPALFGMTQIAPNLYSDAPEHSASHTALVQAAAQRAATYFDEPEHAPRIILCSTQACAGRFGLKPRGLALGRHAILIGPKGMNTTILTHEFTHIHVHAHMGLRDLWHQRIPAWFNEGLAGHISRDTRLRTMPVADAQWIRSAQSYRDWGRLHKTHEWQDTYGAARVLAADIEARLTPAGIKALILDAIETGDFEAALDRATKGNGRQLALTPPTARRITAAMKIYKIFTHPEWTALRKDGSTQGAPVDLADGYVHFSTAEQAAETAAKHFAGADNLFLLCCDADALGTDLKWEVSRGGAEFPHLYRTLQLADVEWAQPLPLVGGIHQFPAGIS